MGSYPLKRQNFPHNNKKKKSTDLAERPHFPPEGKKNKTILASSDLRRKEKSLLGPLGRPAVLP